MSYSNGDVTLLPYPFTNLKSDKVRPAVVVAAEDGGQIVGESPN